MAVEFVNGSSVEPAMPLRQTWPFTGSTSQFCEGWSTWQYVVTILHGVVVYDQGNMASSQLFTSSN
jgi:hypothetical protein